MASLQRLRHEKQEFNAPISRDKFDVAIEKAQLAPGAKVRLKALQYFASVILRHRH